MDQQTILLLVIGGLAVLFLAKMGYLRGPRGTGAASGSLTPGSSPPPAPAAQVITLRHQVETTPAAAAAADGPVHTTQVQIPLTIKVIPQPPAAPPA